MGKSEECTICVSAPGKVILHGEHAVVFGKLAVAASLGLRSAVTLKETKELNATLIIDLPSVGITEKFSIQEIFEKLKPTNVSIDEPKNFNHDEHLEKVDNFLNQAQYLNLKNNQKNALKGILYLFSAILCGEQANLNSISIELKSQLTVGAGTGSSASYGVILSGALIKFALFKKGDSVDSFTQEQKQIVCDWAFNCEKIMHGTPSGIDNAACTHGSIVSFRKGGPPTRLQISLNVRILLVDTGVARETRALAARVAKLKMRNPSAVENVLNAIEDITASAVQVLKDLSEQKRKIDSESHYEHLAELWNMNHCLLASLGVSHESLERIRACALKHGLACKLTGAGGGGYAMILIPPTTDGATIESLRKELTKEGFNVTETSLGGEGVKLDSLADGVQ